MKRLIPLLLILVCAPSAHAAIEFCDLLLIKQTTVGGGDVVGPDSATDNSVCRFDLTTGKVIQDSSGVTISDDGRLELQSTTEAAVLNRLSTAARDALPATNGSVIYNTTKEEFQGHEDGAWRHLGDWPDSWVAVNGMDDFPVPVGGTITLADRTLYVIGADISTDVEFIAGDGSGLTAGSLLGPVFTYTDTGTFITGVDAGFEIKELEIACGAGTCFDFTETVGGTRIFRIATSTLSPVLNFGTIDNLGAFQVDNSALVATGAGVVLAGDDWVVTTLTRFSVIGTSPTFIGVDLGTSTHESLEMSDLVVLPIDAGGVGISGLANSGNIDAGTLGMITGTQFLGGGTPLVGISSADARWVVKDSPPIKSSQIVGCYKMAGNATPTTNLGIGVYGKVLGTTTACAENERFTMSANNELTVTAEFDFSAKLTINLNALRDSGSGAQSTSYTVFKDSGGGFAQLDVDAVSFLDQDNRVKGVYLQVRDLFQTGDKYSVYTNNSDNGNTETLVTSLQVDVEGTL